MSLENASNEFIETSDIKFAYCRLGPRQGTPLIFLQHFTGSMDSWDPAQVDALAESRPVIVFDNTGVGRSSGKTPRKPGLVRKIILVGTASQGGEEHLQEVVAQ